MRKMKLSTLTRIARNYEKGNFTYMGDYAYYIQFDPMMQKMRVIRCRRDRLGEEFFNGSFICNYWEWLEPVDNEVWENVAERKD